MARLSSSAIAYWAAKDPDVPHEWEDCVGYSERRGLYAVADGASAGYRSGDWAAALTQAYLVSFPAAPGDGADDPDALRGWIEHCVRSWHDEQQQPVNWWEQAALSRGDPSATFLGLRISQLGAGLRWEAWAVGDCCLFHVRDGRLTGSFPLTDAVDFTSQPALISTHERHLDRTLGDVRYQSGTAVEGDWFFLTTDALAESLLAHGREVEWAGLAGLGLATFGQLISQLRRYHLIRPDDVSLLAVRISAERPWPGTAAMRRGTR